MACRYVPLHYTTLHYTNLLYTLHYSTHYPTLHYTTLHYTNLLYTLHYSTHYPTLHYTTLTYTTLHNLTLHYPTLPYTALSVNRALIFPCEPHFSDPGYMSTEQSSRFTYRIYPSKLSNFSAYVSRVSEKPLRKGSEQSERKARAVSSAVAGAKHAAKMHLPRTNRTLHVHQILIRQMDAPVPHRVKISPP